MAGIPLPNMSNQQSAKSGASNNSSQGVSSGGVSAPVVFDFSGSSAGSTALINQVESFNQGLNVASQLAGGAAQTQPQLTNSAAITGNTMLYIGLAAAALAAFIAAAYFISKKGK